MAGSGREALDGALTALDAGPGAGSDGKAESRAALWPDETNGLVDELEAQGRERLEDVAEGALLGGGAAGRAGGDLEAPDEVEGECAQELPGGVRVAIVGRDRGEGDLALELGQGLLMSASPRHEVP